MEEKKKGRPQVFTPEEARERKKARNREYAKKKRQEVREGGDRQKTNEYMRDYRRRKIIKKLEAEGRDVKVCEVCHKIIKC